MVHFIFPSLDERRCDVQVMRDPVELRHGETQPQSGKILLDTNKTRVLRMTCSLAACVVPVLDAQGRRGFGDKPGIYILT